MRNRFQAYAFKCNLYRYITTLREELRGQDGVRVRLAADLDTVEKES